MRRGCILRKQQHLQDINFAFTKSRKVANKPREKLIHIPYQTKAAQSPFPHAQSPIPSQNPPRTVNLPTTSHHPPTTLFWPHPNQYYVQSFWRQLRPRARKLCLDNGVRMMFLQRFVDWTGAGTPNSEARKDALCRFRDVRDAQYWIWVCKSFSCTGEAPKLNYSVQVEDVARQALIFY